MYKSESGVESTKTVNYSEAGLSTDFYKNLTKDLRIPVWQDMEMGVDIDGDGVKDSSATVQAHTAFFEGAEGKKWAYEFKKEFEFAQQFIEDMYLKTGVVDEGNAQRFNSIMNILWLTQMELGIITCTMKTI